VGNSQFGDSGFILVKKAFAANKNFFHYFQKFREMFQAAFPLKRNQILARVVRRK
jgi:hypothetical protein